MKTQLQPGSTFAGHRIVRVLGAGGMAVVYLAEHLQLQRTVALKILSENFRDDPKFRERFVRESQSAAAIDHPNIIPIYEAGEADDRLFISMRFVAGTDLKQLLLDDSSLEVPRVMAVLAQVASALDAAHDRHLVHRDVKPANILLAHDARRIGAEHVYLADFGISKRALATDNLTTGGVSLGTIGYMAPEQIQGGAVVPASDIYALGCVAFQSLTGRMPFPRDDQAATLYAHVHEPVPSVKQLRPRLPVAVDEVVARAMAKSGADRFDSCHDFVSALAGAVAGHIDEGMTRRMTPAVQPAPQKPERLAAAVAASAPNSPLPPPMPPLVPAAPRPQPGSVAKPTTAPQAVVRVAVMGWMRRQTRLRVAAALAVTALVIVGAVVLSRRTGGHDGAAGSSTSVTYLSSPMATPTSSASSTPFLKDADGFSVIDAGNVQGRSVCAERPSFFAALSATRVVLRCGASQDQVSLVGVDLEGKSALWTTLLNVQRFLLRGDSEAGMVAYPEMVTQRATGFGPETRTYFIHALSLVDGTEKFRLQLPGPASGYDAQTLEVKYLAVDLVSHDGTVVVHAGWRMKDGSFVWLMYGIGKDGAVRWRHETYQQTGRSGRDFVILDAPNLPTDLMSIDTGNSVLPANAPRSDSLRIYNDDCSNIFGIETQDPLKPPVLTILDAATGKSFTESDASVLYNGHSNNDTMTPQGDLREMGDNTSDTLFITTDGIAWRVNPKLQTGATVSLGRLFMKNQEGAIFEVDQATGKPLSTAPISDVPAGATVEGGVLLFKEESHAAAVGVKFEAMSVQCRPTQIGFQ